MYFPDDTMLIARIEKLLKETIFKAFPDTKEWSQKFDFQMTSPESQFGEYSTNAAMILAKEKKENPQNIAKKIIEQMPDTDFIKSLEIAGPGFINIKLKDDYIVKKIDEVRKKGNLYGMSEAGKGETVIVEYSQPNIAKPLGVHHLLSTIIGQSIFNIYQSLGFKAVAINHIGDWGTQFGKLIVAYKKWGDKKKVEENPIPEMLNLYVKFHEEAEKDAALEDEARLTFKKLEDGDREIQSLWQFCVTESMKDVQKTYDLLGGIHFDHIQGESFYSDKMEEVIKEGKKKKIFVHGEEGALIVKFKNEKYPPYLIQKSDGATLYSTRDLATIKYRVKTWNPYKILYVVDVAQTLHFQQLFETTQRLGWVKDERLIHIIFGRMRFKDAKMSTRKGNIVLLDEVLRKSIKKARKIVEEKNPDLSKKEKEEVARKVGIGSVKYSILQQNRLSDMVFDWEKILSLEGNSAPYLQYTYARYRSISRRVAEANDGDQKEQLNLCASPKEFTDPKERKLAVYLIKYPEIVNHAGFTYKPNIVCNYLYDLTQICNAFYNACPVIRAETIGARTIRLALIEATTIVLKNGLNLLGIEVPERM